MGTLFLVATPIGNLEDLSARALRILSEVKLIAAEDTRQTARLLAHFKISTPLTSYFEHNKLSKVPSILSALGEGDVALVSDAGTPALNDPGYELVRACLEAGFPISPIPGPSAPLAALIVSGLPTDKFTYLGYLPRKGGDRRRFLKEAEALPYTLIFLETPHRLLDALDDMLQVLGNRSISLGRELTKLHEEIFRGSIEQAKAHFTEQEPRGEFTLVVAGRSAQSERWDEAQVLQQLQELTQAGESLSQAAAQVAEQAGWSRRDVYRLALTLDLD